MKKLLVSAAALAVLASAPAFANQALAQKNNCLSCHTVDKKVVGPAYKEVAAKYKDNADAPARLFDKVRSGGSGVWGQVPMMAHPADKISDDDLKAAIHWILALE